MKNHQLKNSQVVRFRCMIQDMFDPELYLGLYQVKCLKSGEMKERPALFRDTVHSHTFEEPLFDDKRNRIMERRLFYCISVPGENFWVKEGLSNSQDGFCDDGLARAEGFGTAMKESTESNKDHLDSESMSCLNERPTSSKSHDWLNTNQSIPATNMLNPLPDNTVFNFPLPSMLGQSKACIAKVYDAETRAVINEVVELVGVLCLDPLLAGQDRFEDSDATLEFSLEAEEVKAHNPPTSLIPRLHVICLRKLPHVNPAVPLTIPPLGNDAADVRSELKKFLVEVFLGDDMCAEYVMLNLISHVYSRIGALPLGKLSLNLVFGVLPSSLLPYNDFSAFVYKVLQSLVPKSFYLDLNLDSLNTSDFAPKKDYISNRLTSGILQLSEGTNLLINDTLRPGQLTSAGISNMGSLSILTASQKVDYDFQFHKLEFHMDIPIIVLSEDRSIISVIQEDFVLSRDSAEESRLTDEDLHTHLAISRLLCQTLGKQSLDEDTWQKARGMERERKYRLKENRRN